VRFVLRGSSPLRKGYLQELYSFVVECVSQLAACCMCLVSLGSVWAWMSVGWCALWIVVALTLNTVLKLILRVTVYYCVMLIVVQAVMREPQSALHDSKQWHEGSTSIQCNSECHHNSQCTPPNGHPSPHRSKTHQTHTARGRLRDRLYDKWIWLLKVSFPKWGTTTQYKVHSINDLDTPIHTGTQLKKSPPSPKINKHPSDLQSTIQDSA